MGGEGGGGGGRGVTGLDVCLYVMNLCGSANRSGFSSIISLWGIGGVSHPSKISCQYLA